MTDALTGSFHRPFDEQLAALELRMSNLVGTARWTDLQKAQHERAFVVAGAMKADLLDDLSKAVLKAAQDGTGLEAFRAQFRDIVQKHGWHGWTGEGTAKGEAWRTKVIYQTNMATSYAAGRMAQLKDGGFSIWVYKHGNAREPRLQHLAWDGIALPPDHPFWLTHACPNGWGCTCRIRGAHNAAGVKRAGGDLSKPLPAGWDQVDPKTGEQTGIDKGWGYAVGTTSSDTINLARDKISKVDAPIGADFGQTLTSLIDRAWPQMIAEAQAGRPTRPALAGVIGREVIANLEAEGVRPMTAEIVAELDKLPAASLPPDMPAQLRRSAAVLMDPVTGQLLYIAPSAVRGAATVARVEYRAAEGGLEGPQANRLLGTETMLFADLVNLITSGTLRLVWGAL